MPSEPRLGDRLCELETYNPALRERYQQEVRAMFERKIGFGAKCFLAAVSVASVAIAGFLLDMAVVHDELPALARVALAGGAVFSAAWAWLAVRAIRRGAFELRLQPAAMAALSWVFAVLLETCLLVLAPQFPNPFHATLALFCGLVILIGAGVMLVTVCIQQAELRTREALLRLEYQIAEMAESRAKAS